MQLLEQQAANLELQTKHRQELAFIQNEFQSLLQKSLAQQKENILKEFKHLMEQYTMEQDLRLKQKLRELQAKQEKEFGDKMDDKVVALQEKLLSHFESDSEDLEVKIRKACVNCFKEEQIDKEFKHETEKYVQNCFSRQSELFKGQIKSGIQQEHLIHKDLINNKLEKLFKASEEKRRMANMLFTRHLSGLTFFVENAQKQLTILNQAHLDLLKNKDVADYYGNMSGSTQFNSDFLSAPLLSPTQSSANASSNSSNNNSVLINSNGNLDLMYLFGSTKKAKNANLKKYQGDDALQDEELLHLA